MIKLSSDLPKLHPISTIQQHSELLQSNQAQNFQSFCKGLTWNWYNVFTQMYLNLCHQTKGKIEWNHHWIEKYNHGQHAFGSVPVYFQQNLARFLHVLTKFNLFQQDSSIFKWVSTIPNKLQQLQVNISQF